MNDLFIGYDKIDSVQPRKQYEMFWEGWTLNFWTPTPLGYTSRAGMFRNGQWGVVQACEPNKAGKWRIPARYVKS